AIVLIRNIRRAAVRGNSVRLSAEQLPVIYSILDSHCRRLGFDPVPDLYLTDRAIPAPGQAFSTYWRDCIGLNARYLERKPEKSRLFLSFFLGRELGRIRLDHTKWWYELLLAYVVSIPYVRNPLIQVQALSHDRYGAFLEPYAIPGLMILASGRRLIDAVDIQQYLKEAREFGGFWALLSDLTKQQPHIS